MLVWMFILAVAALLLAAVVVPRVFGATPYVVETGSMRPGLPPGTLVVTRPTPADEIALGDVVTYQLESGQPQVVTHRVVGLGRSQSGERILQTQGDANDAPDADPVRAVQVRGTLWYQVPFVGKGTNLLTGTQRQVGVLLVGGGLLGYAAFMFLSAASERRGGRTKVEETTNS